MLDECDVIDEDFAEEVGLSYEPSMSEEVIRSEKKGNATYEMILSTLDEGEKPPLSEVIGHRSQKEELLLLIDWFKRSKQLKDKGVSIPKGVILFGEPGNGKSLLIREIIRHCGCPVFVFHGDGAHIAEGIARTFDKAKEAGHSIVVLDELDLLINQERRVIRTLQECLDGVESSEDILVLSATNCLSHIPSALFRPGRLERIIDIPYPTGEEALELLKRHFGEFGLSLPEDFDEEEVALLLNGICYAGVKSVVNDLVLRHGFGDITMDMLDESIYRVTDRVKSPSEDGRLEIAIHEAGHAVMASAFPEFFKVNRLTLSGVSGRFHAKEVDEGYWPYDKVLADIEISMAGILSQKILCGQGSRGCDNDLQEARVDAYNLLTMSGYSSCWETLPPIRDGSRAETPIKRRRMERKIERLLRHCEKKAARHIRAHREEILSLGRLLYQKKRLKSTEILSCIETARGGRTK